MTTRGNPGCPEENDPDSLRDVMNLISGRSANGLTVEEQIAEDTCDEHNVFCCPLCFNGPE
jgi:hypothetical protein